MPKHQQQHQRRHKNASPMLSSVESTIQVFSSIYVCDKSYICSHVYNTGCSLVDLGSEGVIKMFFSTGWWTVQDVAMGGRIFRNRDGRWHLLLHDPRVALVKRQFTRVARSCGSKQHFLHIVKFVRGNFGITLSQVFVRVGRSSLGSKKVLQFWKSFAHQFQRRRPGRASARPGRRR